MISYNINERELDFFGNRHSNIIELVEKHSNIFDILGRIVEKSKRDFSKRLMEDPEPRLYEDKTYSSHTLTNIIKINIDDAIENNLLPLRKRRLYQSYYYNIENELSLYIKQLNSKGLPSYHYSKASFERMHNNEKLPCVFLGPRVDKYGFIGNAFIAITNGLEDLLWTKDISKVSNIDFELTNSLNNDILNSEDIISVKESSKLTAIKQKNAN